MADSFIPQLGGLVPGYRFIVFLEYKTMGFQKVSGVSREIETEVYKEGGLNNRVHVFPKAPGGERVLRLEKGVHCESFLHPFYMVGERIRDNLHLIVMGEIGIPQKSYVFTGLVIKKWEVGDMDAGENRLLIDRFEISYEDMDVLI